jgi:glycosyltransferase involved in cell wall biosynthesis
MTIGANVRLLTGSHLEGIARYTLETIKSMALAHPTDNWILFFDRKVDVEFGFPSNVIMVVLHPQARHPLLWRWWFDIAITRALKRYKVDVFYSPDGYTSLTTSVPSVMVLHDLAYIHYPEHFGFVSLWDYKIFVPKYLKKAQSIVTVSNFVKEDIASRFPNLANKLSVAYNAYNKPNFNKGVKSIENHSGKPYFLYVGSLNPRKNIDRLIEGFLMFNAGNGYKYNLILAGKVMNLSAASIALLKNSTNVNYLGPVTDDEKISLICNAKAMIYVSLFEGFGIPILEAFAHGVPVITSSTSSMPEVAGGAALLVDPNSTESISNAISQLVESPNLAQELIALGNKRVEDFTWQESANTIYEQLVRCTI